MVTLFAKLPLIKQYTISVVHCIIIQIIVLQSPL